MDTKCFHRTLVAYPIELKIAWHEWQHIQSRSQIHPSHLPINNNRDFLNTVRYLNL